jgi:hypothetical protein
MAQAESDFEARAKATYELARQYVLSFRGDGVTDEVLDAYLEPRIAPPSSINDVYRRLLESAQNSNMRPAVIGESIGGLGSLRHVLCDFDPRAVQQSFSNGWEEVLDLIVADVHPSGKIRRTPRSIWPLFCRAILSGADFLSQFADAQEFCDWVDVFDRDDRIRPALPMLISYEVDGLGFPLACDFLKELGYLNFGKPDVHVKAILSGLGFTRSGADDYETFKAIVSVAKAVGFTPYRVDKLLWLVGSGRFYDHPNVGSSGFVRTDRSAFIDCARRTLDDVAPA